MVKVSFATLWKLAVLVLLAVIAFYSYKIHGDLSGSYLTPTPIGCGVYNTPMQATGIATRPAYCVQPLQTTKK